MSLNKADGIAAKTADIQGVLEDVRTLRTRLDSMSNQLGALKRYDEFCVSLVHFYWHFCSKVTLNWVCLLIVLLSLCRENGALWRELAIMWQRHTKQQQVVGKVCSALVSHICSCFLCTRFSLHWLFVTSG